MLSNAELLAIIIKSGTKENTSVELANKILSLHNNTIIEGNNNIFSPYSSNFSYGLSVSGNSFIFSDKLNPLSIYICPTIVIFFYI